VRDSQKCEYHTRNELLEGRRRGGLFPKKKKKKPCVVVGEGGTTIFKREIHVQMSVNSLSQTTKEIHSPLLGTSAPMKAQLRREPSAIHGHSATYIENIRKENKTGRGTEGRGKHRRSVT